jgi:hypothetical protein
MDAAHALATPLAARDRIRSLKAEHKGAASGPITVEFAPGLYALAGPLVLEPQDSGDPDAAVTYRAAPGSEVVLSGGTRLPAWHNAKLDGHDVWATAYRSPAPANLRELWVSGERRTRARHPNNGYLQVRDVPDLPKGTPEKPGPNYFRYRDEDAALWTSIEPGTEVVAYTRWVSSHMHLDQVDAPAHIAKFDRRTMFVLRPGDLYFLEGQRRFLDAPGEWWHDEKAGILYYLPMPGETQDKAAAAVPRLDQLLSLAGDPGHGSFVHDVNFEGLTFSHATWWYPDDAPQSDKPKDDAPLSAFQAAWKVPGAIRADGAQRVEFRHCTFAHLGGYAVELARGCTDNTLSSCTLTDLGAGGVRIGETQLRDAEAEQTKRNTVSDCIIQDGGHLFPEAVGVWIGQSADNTIEHNRIADFLYTGISIGWTWGYGPAHGGGNIVRFNDIGPIGTRPSSRPHARTEPLLGDMGGVYTLGAQQGTIIANNLIHDVSGHTIAWGIYFDEGTSGAIAERNVVMHTTHGSFHQHYGQDNIVRNNLFMDPGVASLWRTRKEDHLSFTLTDNVIVVPPDGQAFHNNWTGDKFALSDNAYLYTNNPPKFPADRSLEAWQNSGQDAGSLVERIDPGLAQNPAAIIERFRDRLGDINLTSIGPRH